MSSLEVNKIVGAVLLAGMIAMISGLIAGALVRPKPAEKVAVATPAAESAGQPASTAPEPLKPVSPLLATADVKAGEEIAKRCAQCHTFQKGEKAKVGPNLWGIVGNKHGHMEGFPYSKAIASIDKPWDYEQLNAFIASPQTYAPGTKMTFAGLKKVEERAEVIAWLRTLSDSPVPLPPAGESSSEAAPAAAPAASGGQAASATGTTAQPKPEEQQPAAAAQGTAGEAAPAQGTTGEAAAPQAAASETASAAAPAGDGEPIAARLAHADPAEGQKVAQRCAACHTFEKDAPNKIGPNLWEVVGAKHAHRDDFKFSAAIAGIDKPWSYEELDIFLTAPQAYAPGTKMTFAGLKNARQRADVIAYLRTLSDSPKPLP